MVRAELLTVVYNDNTIAERFLQGYGNRFVSTLVSYMIPMEAFNPLKVALFLF
jgi:hypothetical protein